MQRTRNGRLPSRAGSNTLTSAGLQHPVSLVVAGSAGGRVRSAARVVAETAIRSGLWAVQRDDYPVTVQTGHSTAELVLSPRELPLLPIGIPDVLVLVSADGLRQASSYLEAMTEASVVVTTAEFAQIATRARHVVLDPASAASRIGKADLALALLGAAVTRLGLLPIEALREAAADGPFGESNLAAVEAGLTLSGWPPTGSGLQAAPGP